MKTLTAMFVMMTLLACRASARDGVRVTYDFYEPPKYNDNGDFEKHMRYIGTAHMLRAVPTFELPRGDMVIQKRNPVYPSWPALWGSATRIPGNTRYPTGCKRGGPNPKNPVCK